MLNAIRRPRAGYTVMEMLVALVLGCITIGLVGAFGFRQQRLHRDLVVAAERLEQLEQAAALLPIALRSIAPPEGDIPPGGARDTSLEFRATIASAVVCDSGDGRIVLAPAHTEPPILASVLTRPVAGDTAWSLALGASGESWIASGIDAVSDSTATCLLGGASPWAGGPRSSLVLRLVGPLSAGQGTPVRVTRTWRYSIYRASDGDWYLGAKDWNPATQRFNTIQPVSGPLV